jgi:hypothetical protein
MTRRTLAQAREEVFALAGELFLHLTLSFLMWKPVDYYANFFILSDNTPARSNKSMRFF